MKALLNQELILSDRSSTGRVNDWSGKKMANELLALAYDEVNEKKAARLRDCATWLAFARSSAGGLTLTHANFCRVRLCPICQWRRALKTYAHTRKIVEAMAADYRRRKKGLRWVFLTLTIQNCSASDLSTVVDNMFSSWHRLIKSKAFEPVLGWYRGFEVVHDVSPFITAQMFAERSEYYRRRGLRAGDDNPNYNMYHPHFHVMMAVNTTFLRTDYRTLRARFAAAWQKAMRLDYEPVVDVRKAFSVSAAGIAEACKYTVKDTDYIQPADWDLTVETVELLDKVLDRRRLIAYGGDLKEWHRRLNLDDEENGDLIHTDDAPNVDEAAASEIVFSWSTGYRQYIASL